MIRATLVLWVAMLCSSLSNVLTRRGMVEMGPLEDYAPGHVAGFIGRAVTNRHVMLGLVAGAGNFLLWLVVLSWADVSWALPMNAVEYVVTALMAVVWLKERVAPKRWAAIGLITAGVACVMGSWG